MVKKQVRETPRKRIIATSQAKPDSKVGSHPAVAPQSERLVQELQGRTFATQEEALDFLINSISGQLTQDESTRAELKEYLSLIIETDPVLREEIVQAVKVRR